MNSFNVNAAFEPDNKEQSFAGTGAGRHRPPQHRLDVRVRVVSLPRRVIDPLPLVARHARVARGHVIQVVLVHVRVHPDAGFVQSLMIFGAGQRRQIEEFQQVNRQLFLNDADVAQDRCRRVAGEAENVAAVGDNSRLLPCQQHLAVFGNLVLPLLRTDQVVRIDVLQPDEDALDAGALGLLDEVRQPVAERVYLDDEAHLQAFDFAQVNQAVEDRFPVFVAGEVVVGDEEAVQALRDVGADDTLNVVGRAAARLAPLDVDDRAERALIRAAAPGVQAGVGARRALDPFRRQQRHRRAFQMRQVVHEVVERRETPRERVLEHLIEAAFGFACEQRHAHVERPLHVRVALLEHGNRAGNMKAAEGNRDAALTQRRGDVESTRELV